MKEIHNPLGAALSSMKGGVLNLRNLQETNLEEVFTFLRDPSTPTEKITSLDISTYRDWKKVKDFILKFDNSLLFKPQSIKIARFFQYTTEHEIKTSEFVNEILALRLKTAIDINSTYIDDTNYRKETLLKKFLEEFKKNDFNEEEEQLNKFIKVACKEAKTPDNIDMQFMQALRIFSEFDFSKIDEKYSDLQHRFTKLYKAQEVKSEIYHYKVEDDLHFYMVKVNGANVTTWQNFSKKQGKFIKGHVKKEYIKAFMGLDAFDSSIKYHDQDLTEIYVAFTYNKAWEKKSSIDILSVEMVITMATSQNANFISHIGIAKAPIYDYFNIKKHSSLSLKLHSFIAACTEIIYPNKKEYMVTVPTKNMTHIIIKEYEKKGILDKIYIGHQDTKIPQESLEELKSEYKNTQCTSFEGMAYDHYFELYLKYILKNQQENLGDKKVPIKFTEAGWRVFSEFILYGKSEEVLNDLKSDQIKGEFAWFCTSPYLLKNQQEQEPLITCDLETLAGLDHRVNPIDYEEYREIIGEAITPV